jgi:hypothetical protein
MSSAAVSLHTEEASRIHDHEGERSFESRQDLDEGTLEIGVAGGTAVGEQLADEIAVGGEDAGEHPE